MFVNKNCPNEVIEILLICLSKYCCEIFMSSSDIYFLNFVKGAHYLCFRCESCVLFHQLEKCQIFFWTSKNPYFFTFHTNILLKTA